MYPFSSFPPTPIVPNPRCILMVTSDPNVSLCFVTGQRHVFLSWDAEVVVKEAKY